MEKLTVTAKVQTPSGMSVEITGSKEEVKELVASLTSRKRERAKERHMRPLKPRSASKWKSLVAELALEGFFKGKERGLAEVVARVNEKGYNVRGRIVGALASALTSACRDPEIGLQRRHLSKGERKEQEKWAFFQR